MITRSLLLFVMAFGHIYAIRGQSVPDSGSTEELARPVVTQAEILRALGLEIAKIRVVNIPKGERVVIELVEFVDHGTSRRLARVPIAPVSDWVEILMSAQTEADGCRKVNLRLSHESPIFTEFVIDIEKQFGVGKRALPASEGFSQLFHVDSCVISYPSGLHELASFRLNSGKRDRRYYIELIAYPEPNLEKKK